MTGKPKDDDANAVCARPHFGEISPPPRRPSPFANLKLSVSGVELSSYNSEILLCHKVQRLFLMLGRQTLKFDLRIATKGKVFLLLVHVQALEGGVAVVVFQILMGRGSRIFQHKFLHTRGPQIGNCMFLSLVVKLTVFQRKQQ